jgi:GTP cyclohydrolase II
MAGSGTSGLFGAAEQIAVERGLGEFRCGRSVILTSVEERVAVLPVDGMTDEALVSFRRLCAPARPYLLITARRARALGLEGAGPTGLAVGDLHDHAAIFSLAADAQVTRRLEVVPTGKTATAAIELAKLARLLPALLVCENAPRPRAQAKCRSSPWPPMQSRSFAARRPNRWQWLPNPPFPSTAELRPAS